MRAKNIPILVVDDESTIVGMLTYFLSSNGYSVTGVTDSREALNLIEKTTFDIVLTDLQMPEVTGMDIVRAINESDRDTEVIILTAFASIDSTIEALKFGVNDYLRKPFQLNEILLVIDRAAEKLALKRRNLALQQQVEKMLDDITMLVDISSILYQVPDFEGATDMILDTLTEGMKAKKVGLFLPNGSRTTYAISKAKGLSDDIIEKFKFRLDDRINDVQLSPSEPTIIRNIDAGLSISGRALNILADGQFNCCIFAPIQYLESLHGFIGIFHMHEPATLDNELKLLKVLATQVAPIFQEYGLGGGDTDSGRSCDRLFVRIIADRIEEAKRLNSSVSFASFKLTGIPESIKTSTITSVGPMIQELIGEEIPPLAEAILLDVDTVLIVFPGGNPANVELTCAKIRRNIEEQLRSDNAASELPLKYAITNFPIEAATAAEAINWLWVKLQDVHALCQDCL